MLGNIFGNDAKKHLAESVQRIEFLGAHVKRLESLNSTLKEEIEGLYRVLVKKESYIFKLKKVIVQHLKDPDFVKNIASLDEELQDMFKKEDYYDPRKKHKKTVIESPLLPAEKTESPILPPVQTTQSDMNGWDLLNSGIVFETTIKPEEIKNEEIKPEEKKEDKLSLDDMPDIGEFKAPDNVIPLPANPEQNVETKEDKENKTEESGAEMKRHGSATEADFEKKVIPSKESIDEDKKYAIIKMKEDRRFLIKIKDVETVSRELFVFELELKEYTYSSFEAIKQFVVKETITPEEVHEEIDRLSNIVSKTKYFKSVFPKDTEDRVTYELENYVFEILYPRLFALDEDAKGFALQLKDRLNVLKQIVTFDMLDVPIQLRRESLFNVAIREFKKMNDFKSPGLKLQVFQNCANYVIDLFLELVKRNPDLDELFPIFVFIVLQANIDFLKVNVDYIYTYLRKSLKYGQEGFLIINLKAVIKFLSELDGNSLRQGKLEIKETSKLYE